MKKSELEMARDQLAEISKTLEGNEWFDYIASHLLPVHYELERQLSHEEDNAYTSLLAIIFVPANCVWNE